MVDKNNVKCPCINCITLPVCIRSDHISPLLQKCSFLLNFITTKQQAAEVIELIKPVYYLEYNRNLSKERLDKLLEESAIKVLDVAVTYKSEVRG